jgi:hypothetical protein
MGLSRYGHGDYAGAIEVWERLLATMGEERGYKVLYNLALAYQGAGDITKAVDAYSAFEARVAALPDPPKASLARAAEARARRQQLEKSNGLLHVQAPRRGGPVLTRLDSSEPRPAGYAAWLPPGPHQVTLSVGTEGEHTVPVTIEAGKTQEVDSTPPEPPPATPQPVAVSFVPAPAPAQPEAQSGVSNWVWIGAGATLVSAALPAILFAVASTKRDDAAAFPTGSTQYPGARDTYDTWRTAYYASYALPGALAAATVAVLVWPRAQVHSKTAVAITPAGVSLSVAY